MTEHRWRKALIPLTICVVVSHDGGGPVLATHREPGFTIGYPANWSVDPEPDVTQAVMVAHPFLGEGPDLTVEIHPAGTTARDLLKDLAGYGDLTVTEHRPVTIRKGLTGELIHAFYDVINTDNERYPTEETTFITTGGQGRVIALRFSCHPGECRPSDPTVQAVISSITV